MNAAGSCEDLADLDEMAVGIPHIAADLAAVIDGRG
jgi:hypothetical protein